MNVINPKSVMVGHRLFFGDDYSILGNTSNKWISTYLFFMTGKLINVFEKNICLNEDTLSNLVTIDSGELLWGDISTSLSNHIEEWMFPNDETKGWYGNNNNDSAMKLRKIKTILNEKFLSAKCNSVNGKTYDYDLFRVMKYLGRR